MERIAFNPSRKSTSIGRPAFDARGRKGSTRAHSSSVKSLGYRLVFFSILAIRPRVAGVHIPSLNHDRKPHSTTFQTDSKAALGGAGQLPQYGGEEEGGGFGPRGRGPRGDFCAEPRGAERRSAAAVVVAGAVHQPGTVVARVQPAGLGGGGQPESSASRAAQVPVDLGQ